MNNIVQLQVITVITYDEELFTHFFPLSLSLCKQTKTSKQILRQIFS